MSTLVVLAIVAAVVGALGSLLTRRFGHRGGRHGGGSPAVPRAIAVAPALLVAVGILWPFLSLNELAMAGIALWWASLPWLALTSRLSAWGHAAWALGANAAAAGMVHLAWLITSSGLSPLHAAGSWLLWMAASGSAVLFLLWARQTGSAEPEPATAPQTRAAGRAAHRADRARRRPGPALPAAWVAGAASAVALALVLQPGPPATPSASGGPVGGAPAPNESAEPSVSTTTPAPRTTAPTGTPTTGATVTTSAPTTTATPGTRTTTSVSRGRERPTTGRPRRTDPTPGTTPTPTTASPSRTPGGVTLTLWPQRKKPKPTTTSTTSTTSPTDEGG